jgi:hypothetical protein
VREVICTGPVPPPGAHFCVMCALRYKAECLELIQDDIQELMRGEGEPVTVNMIAKTKGRVTFPSLAVATGVCQPLGGILAELCWGHIQAVKFSSVALAGPGDMTGTNGQPLPLMRAPR